ncbi:retrovirus-related pol polyprotein from transposon TNT 1-94 [Tanacetum coccineum]|uniref:Retrovirus-related pol polyprotein from transposon TNT 1-94 n=1 Tax=Tanacetum coccineum TaxID=301880 RepID=A0ABQ5FWK1_9ASTR
MSGTIPPIPPPFGTSSGIPSDPNVNRVDTMPTTTDHINTTSTINVSQSVVDENLPQLLDSRGGSHVTNVPAFDKEDFTNWKVRFLVFLDGLEPYLLKTLEDGPFVPMSSLSTFENPLPKRQNQWSNAESPVIKCKIAKEMWNGLILAHEGPSDTRDTKITALKLKFNAFKSLEGEKVNGTFIRLKCFLNDLENNGVTIPQAEVNATFVNSLPRKWLSINQTQRANNSIKNDCLATLDSDVEEDQRTSNEFMADLNVEYHERALLANQKRFYKRSGRVRSARKPIDKTKETCFTCGKSVIFKRTALQTKPPHHLIHPQTTHSTNPNPTHHPSTKHPPKTLQKGEKGKNEKGKSKKGLIAESFDWDEEFVSSEDEGTTRIRAFMAIVKDEPLTCSKVTLDQLLSEQVSGNIVKALGGKGRRKENNFSKEVVFTKADEFSSEPAPNITSDSKTDCDTQEPLHALPKLIGAEPLTYVIKKTEPKVQTVQISCSKKKASPSTKQLLLTLMEEVKGIKDHIKIPSVTSSSGSQASSSIPSKQKVWSTLCIHYGLKNHLFDDCYSKPKCSTCGSNEHLTREHTIQTAVKRTLNKLKNQPPLKPTPNKTSRMSNPSSECKYYGSNKHHLDNCEFYSGCEICGSIAHEITNCPKNLRNIRKQRIANMQSTKLTEKVAYVNCLKHNLISISQLCDANFLVLFTKSQGTIFNQNGEVVLIAPRRRDVYLIDMSSFNKESNTCFFAKASPSVNWLWHKRLSHFNFKNINNLAKHNLASGIPSLTFSKDKNCSACKKGKNHRASFKTKRSFSISKSLHLLHMDLFGPVKPQNISHNKYTLVIVDEYSRKMENLNEVRVKELRSDNGTEFKNYKLEEFYNEKGIS